MHTCIVYIRGTNKSINTTLFILFITRVIYTNIEMMTRRTRGGEGEEKEQEKEEEVEMGRRRKQS